MSELDFSGDYQDAMNNTSLCMHIEPAHDSLDIPVSLYYSGNVFRFKGQFFKEMQYGNSVEDGGLARTFRYTGYKLIYTSGIWEEELLHENSE